MPFEPISPRDFCATIAGNGSPRLAREFARFEFADPAAWPIADGMIHEGPLVLTGSFTPPSVNTLITGDLDVAGLVDCDTGYDAGGLLVVLGNVSCGMFSGHFGASAFVDGDLDAWQFMLTAFEDSAFVVAGQLRTRFHYGWDIAVHVGNGARVEYGDGYCLPLGSRDATADAIMPRHDRDTSRRLLAGGDVDEDIGLDLQELIKDGRTPFR